MIYLRASSEETLISKLSFARKDNQWVLGTHNYFLNIIGTLYNDDEVYSEEDDSQGEKVCISPPTPKSGFHANLLILNDDFDPQIPEEIILITPPNKILRVLA